MSTPVELIIEGTDNSKGAFASASGSLSKIGQIAAGILTSQVFTQLANGVINFGKSVLNSAIESEAAITDLNATIQSTGGVAGVTSEMAQKLANDLQTVTRFSDETTLGAENMLLTFTKIGKEVFPAATEAALNMATKFKTDPTQAAIQLGKALNDPIEGVGALRRVGVALSQEQENQIKKFVQMGDMASAQKVILGELNTEFGGLARAMGTTFAGRLDILKNRFDNMKETIGGALIPIIEKLFDKFEPFIPVIEEFANKLAGAFTSFGESLDNFPSDPIGLIADLLYKVGSALEGMGVEGANNFFSNLGDNFIEGATAIKNFIDNGLSFLSQWWTDNGPGITAVVQQVFGGIQKTFNEIQATAGPFISEVFGKIAAWMTENGPLIQQYMKQGADLWTNVLLPAVVVVWNTLRPILGGLLDLILGLAKTVMQIATGDWSGAWTTIKSIAVNAFNALVNAAMNLISGVLGILGTSVPEIAEKIHSGFEKARANIQTTFENIKSNIINKFTEIRTGIETKITDVINSLKSKLSLFQNIGANIVLSIKTGITNAWNGFIDWILSMVGDLINTLLASVGAGGSNSSSSSSGTSSTSGLTSNNSSVTNSTTQQQTLYNFGTINKGSSTEFKNLLDAFG